MKRCQSCGRLTELLEDFASLDHSSIYCSSCADGSGKLKTFEEVLENLTQRIAKTDGFDEQASQNAALQILGRQPAWEPRFAREEGMKTNKKRLLMITVSTIFAITAGGVTWWLTSKYYKNWGNHYELHIVNYDDPFKNIKVEKKDAFTVSEFRCKGDQELSKLEDGLLQFKSYEDLGVLPFDENLISDQLKDYSSYIVNLESMQSANLEKITYGYSKADRDKLEKLVNCKKDVIEWQSPRSMINIVAGYPELRKKQTNVPKQDLFISHNLFKHIRYSIKQRKFLNYEDLRFFGCMSTDLEYRYKDKTLESFNVYEAQKYGLNNYVYIFEGEEFPELKAKYLIGGIFLGVLKTKGAKVLMRFSTRRSHYAPGSGFVKFLVIDMEKETFTQLDYPKT